MNRGWGLGKVLLAFQVRLESGFVGQLASRFLKMGLRMPLSCDIHYRPLSVGNQVFGFDKQDANMTA